MTPEQGRALALAYEQLAAYNPAARAAWDCMARDEAQQFDYAARIVRIEPWAGAGQPYPDSRAMRADVLERRRLYVFAGGSPHPCRTAAEIFRGRAVHDLFAHALTGADFGPVGETAAFRAHVRLYHPDAWPALACDNLGQTAFYFYHPRNIDRPHAARIWAEQKVDFLPRELWEVI